MAAIINNSPDFFPSDTDDDILLKASYNEWQPVFLRGIRYSLICISSSDHAYRSSMLFIYGFKNWSSTCRCEHREKRFNFFWGDLSELHAEIISAVASPSGLSVTFQTQIYSCLFWNKKISWSILTPSLYNLSYEEQLRGISLDDKSSLGFYSMFTIW